MTEGVDAVYLLQGATTDVVGDAVDLPIVVRGEFAYRTCYIGGTFDGTAKVTVEASPDDGVTYFAMPNLTDIQAATMVNISVRCDKIRAKITNATGSNDIDVILN